MLKRGYLILVLQGHTPFVRHPEIEHSLEETWLFELITDTYVPLIEVCHALQRDGIESNLTISLTPCLLSMLEDQYLRERYRRYVQERITFLDGEVERLRNDSELGRLARMYRERYVRCLQVFCYAWGSDLVAAFRHLQNSGAITVLASAATHAYLPLWENYPEIVHLQVRAGIEWYRHCFARRPTGFWMPECGFFRNLDQVLHTVGIRYAFLDTHGLVNGDTRSKYREFAPVHSRGGVAMFARDRGSHDQVWLRERAYHGDPAYAEFSGDIGFHWDSQFLLPITHGLSGIPTGIRYYCRFQGGQKNHYDPCVAQSRCEEHAEHFVAQCEQRVADLAAGMDREPVIVAMFDMEHFGHWWQEGPIWLDRAIRRLACRKSSVKIITAEDYLRKYPTNQVVDPSMSSWGYQGYSEAWLMGDSHWIYPAVYKELEAFRLLGARNLHADGVRRAALNQFLRECLLAQASDWAFIIRNRTMVSYATRRVREHLENMARLRSQLDHDCMDAEWVRGLLEKNSLFGGADLFGWYAEALSIAGR